MKQTRNPECRIEIPFEISAEEIGLETGGAVIEEALFLRAGETGPGVVVGQPAPARTDHFCLLGRIRPHDPAAQDIHFAIGLPTAWNGKAMQTGGGGLDGYLPSTSGIGLHADMPGEPDALGRGYAVFGSDSGHVLDPAAPVDCAWGVNEEMLENFGWKALKKVYDVAMRVIEAWYGRLPEKVYFSGGSNGGREALKILQKCPEDYDGAIVLFPVIRFLIQMIAANETVKALDRLGPEAEISMEDAVKTMGVIRGILDGADGLEDGIISCRKPSPAQERRIEEALGAFLNEKQIAFLRALAADFTMPYPVTAGGDTSFGFQVLMGAEPRGQILGAKHEKDNYLSAVAKNMISCFVLKDPEADPLQLDFERDREAILRAAEIIQADDPDLDAWFARGGKMILLQGNLDPLVPMNSTIRYAEDLEKRYGPALKEHLAFYLIPGCGHGGGDAFHPYVPLMQHLEDWVEKGVRPGTILATDVNKATFGRTRPLYEYPFIPVYGGSGDPDRAESFIPRNVTELSD